MAAALSMLPETTSLRNSNHLPDRYEQPENRFVHKSRKPMNHAAAKRAKLKRRNKRLHPKGCK